MDMIGFVAFIDVIIVPAVSDAIYYYHFSCQVLKYRFGLALKSGPAFTQSNVMFEFWIPTQIHFKAKSSMANPY